MIAAILLILLAVYLAFFIYAWCQKGRPFQSAPSEGFTRFSIVISARDEEANIQHRLQNLEGLDYPKEFFEVILVDDHSADGTVNLATEWLERLPLRILTNDGEGKKAALQTGIRASLHPWIITSDADAWAVSPLWLQKFNEAISSGPSLHLVSGPVRLQWGESLFHRLQALEYCCLNLLGGLYLRTALPNICSGANLAFSRTAFDTVGGYADISKVASGDDELLMHKIHRQFGRQSCRFLSDKEAIVETLPQPDWTSFWNQRKRWASKGGHYAIPLRLVLGTVWLFHASLFGVLVLCVFRPEYFLLWLMVMMVKIVVDVIHARKAAEVYHGRRQWGNLYPIAAIPYLGFITLAAILGNFGRYRWKGRRTG